MERIKIAIVGRGNVATHLTNAIASHSDLFEFAGIITRECDSRPEAYIYIVCVSDDAIKSVTNELFEWIPSSSIVLHTSGSKSIDEIDNNIEHRGVIYPLQTFTKGVNINLKHVPIFFECNNTGDREVIESVAKAVGGDVQYCSSERRIMLHIAAVFSSNFTTYMLSVAQKVCCDEGIDFALLHPLIKETVRKSINANNISEVQTGPAVRGDVGIVEAHIKLLQERDSDLADIYKEISSKIGNRR